MNEVKFKILIVDDERSNILSLNHILKPAYSTLAAIDGQSAIETAKKSVPDLILLDVIMPDMTGFEVLAELKYCEQTQNIPVIFITGLDSVEDEETGFFLGAVDYITKPFHSSIVRARVKTHLQIVRQIRTIERFGMVDALMEIPNRRSFDKQLNVEWARAVREKMPLGILMVDIDNFKIYNDKYGHPQGDALLQALAGVFSQTLKRPGDFVARIGGEEFVVLLPNTGINGAQEVANQLRVGVECMIVPCVDGQNTSVTISAGVNSKIPTTTDSIVEFMTEADKRLYRAKNEGRNRVCVSLE